MVITRLRQGRPWPLLTVEAVGLVLALGAGVDQSTPQFKTSVDLVQVDVTVLDRRNQPVGGLAATDFTILENGKPQAVAAFLPVNLPKPEAFAAAWMRTSPADVASNQFGEQRLVVVLIDDQLPLNLLSTRTLKEGARAAVEQVGPADLAAVVFINNHRDSEEFTNDRARLLSAVEKYRPIPGSADTLSALIKVTDALGAIPNRRKTLIYVGPGEDFGLELLRAAFIPPDIRAPGAQEAPIVTMGEKMAVGTAFDKMRELVRRAQRASVNIYAIDPSGLPAPDQTGRMRGEGHRDFLLTMSRETGGRAVVLNNRPDRELPGIFAESGSYYMLGFVSTDSARDGKLRRLSVKVNRPDVEVRHRGGYVAPRVTEPEHPVTPALPIDSALNRLVPSTGFPLVVTSSAFVGDLAPNTVLAIAVGLPGDQSFGEVDLRVSLFAEKDTPLMTQRGTVPASQPDGTGRPVMLLSRMDVKPGRYGLRVSAQDTSTGQTGSVFTTVNAPDFTKATVSLSGVVFAETPQARYASRAQLGSLLPVLPTVTRSFARSSRVAAFLRVYQASKRPAVPVTVKVELIDGKDRAVLVRAETLGAAAFTSTRSVDFRAELPVGELEPNPYLVRVTATAGRDSAVSSVPIVLR